MDIIKRHNIRFRTDIRKAEDTLFYAQYLTLINKVVLSTIAPYNYRIRPQSLTTSYRKPTLLGIEKGLSILEDFQHYARSCHGLPDDEITEYFQKRHVRMFLNHVINLTDSRSGLSSRDINNQIKTLYGYPALKHAIDSLHFLQGNTTAQKMESIVVKSRLGLMIYGKTFNMLKKLKNKLQ